LNVLGEPSVFDSREAMHSASSLRDETRAFFRRTAHKNSIQEVHIPIHEEDVDVNEFITTHTPEIIDVIQSAIEEQT
jgi:hypothetical protein